MQKCNSNEEIFEVKSGMSGYLYPWIRWIQSIRYPHGYRIGYKFLSKWIKGYRIGYKILSEWIQDTGLDTQNVSEYRIYFKNETIIRLQVYHYVINLTKLIKYSKFGSIFKLSRTLLAHLHSSTKNLRLKKFSR